ncbi:MAG: MerR family transcriptional regulator [Candidatus Sulfotelmatobacter sp.]
MTTTNTSLRSGTLAHLTGVSPDTIRYYERIGVLPRARRTASRYRIYGRDAADRVRLVQGSLRMGFTLAELSEIFRVSDSGAIPSPSPAQHD